MTPCSARAPAAQSSILSGAFPQGGHYDPETLISGLDLQGKLWVCPFCMQRNPLPPQYGDINENRLPAEVIPTYSTLEYVLPRHTALPPIFLFTIDLCIETDWERELQALKDSLLLSLNLLPENAYVGLITFGQTVTYFPVLAALLSRIH